MSKVVKFNTAYGDRKRKGFETTGDSLTQQSHASAADVRNIIKQYDRTGLIANVNKGVCLLYTSPSPRDGLLSRMPSSA